MAIKIAVIGGGSSTFMPSAISDLIKAEELKGSKLVLMDVDISALQIMAKFGRRVVEETKASIKVEDTIDRHEALDGADFVITTFGVGGIEGWKKDYQISNKYGVDHGIADSVGPGGISRALRHVPVIVDIAKDMEKLCPSAWLINYSNPMSSLCYAVNEYTNIEVIGLCTCITGATEFFANIYQVEPYQVQITAAGINHLTWLLDLRIKGKEIKNEDLCSLLDTKIKELRFPVIGPVAMELYKVYGLFPINRDSHVAEFYSFFYGKNAKKYGLEDVNTSAKFDREKTEVIDKIKKKERPTGVKGEVATKIIGAIHKDENKIFEAVNIPNNGSLIGLPDNAIVEVPVVIGSYGYRPLTTDSLPNGIIPILYSHFVQQQLTVKAALSGDKDLVLQALLLDSNITSMQQARDILEEILRTYASYLPRFNKKSIYNCSDSTDRS